MSTDRTPEQDEANLRDGKKLANGTYDGAGRHAVYLRYGHAPCAVNHVVLFCGSGLDEAMRAEG